MTDIVQRVETIFTADVTALKAAAASVQGDFDKAGESAAKAQAKARESFVKVQGGFTNSAGTNDFTRAAFGGRRSEAFASDAMLDELERMRAAAKAAADLRAAAKAAKPPVVDLGEALKSVGTKAGGSTDEISSFRDRVKGAIGPAEDMRSGLAMLRENIGMFGLAIPSLVLGIVEIFTSMDTASAAAVEWGKSLEHAKEDFIDFKNFLKEQEDRRNNVEPDSELLAGLKAARAKISGEDVDGGKDGMTGAGFWQKAADREVAAINLYEETVKRARAKGFKLDGPDKLAVEKAFLTPTEQFNLSRDPNGEAKMLEDQRILVRELKREYDRMTDASAARKKVEDENAKLLWEQTVAAADLLGKLDRIKDIGSIVIEGVSKGITDLGNQIATGVAQNFAALKTDKEKQADFGKGFAKLLGIDLKSGKTGVHIDARNAKISVSNRIETDDPARMANASVTAAFLGATAKPLSAIFQIGGVSSGSR